MNAALPGAHPSEAASASDEVIDTIAEIEMQRRETEKQAGLAMSCSSALHRLHELHDHETEALRLRGLDSGHQANVQAVTIEIARVKGLSAVPGQNSSPFPRNARNERQREASRNESRSPAGNSGRRTTGRAGGR